MKPRASDIHVTSQHRNKVELAPVTIRRSAVPRRPCPSRGGGDARRHDEASHSSLTERQQRLRIWLPQGLADRAVVDGCKFILSSLPMGRVLTNG
jgi:hypothetical protein